MREDHERRRGAMTDWTSGYVADVDYSFGYYAELNPLRLRLALLNVSWAPPACTVACELGFGQGVSVNVHAAASNAAWYGADFNPGQASFARDLAQACGSGAQLTDEAFADFCARPDLPDFDFIGVHGVWSWVSEQNRAVIVDFLRRKLKPGGVVYISYNTLPGHAAMVPLRHLLARHAEVMEVPGRGLMPRIGAAMEFAQRMLTLNPAYGVANPQIAERLAGLMSQDRHYLAHEYFNRDWRPMHFGDMAEWLATAKLSYAGSAHFLDHVDVLNLTADQQAFLNEIPDTTFRETVRDFMVNQQFRRDYWIKGRRPLSALERGEIVRQERFMLLTPRDKVALSAKGSSSVVETTGLRPEVYGPVLDRLADHRPRTFGEIEQGFRSDPDGFAKTFQVLAVLIGKGDVAPVQDERVAEDAKARTDRLNRRFMAQARSGNDIAVLASPVTGGGVLVNRFQQLFLLARSHGEKTAADWAAYAWNILQSQDQLIIKDGETLQDPAENLAELRRQATALNDDLLPVLKAAMVI
jgi:SAM-dependent methyltransferase